jgi:hypothetical protein
MIGFGHGCSWNRVFGMGSYKKDQIDSLIFSSMGRYKRPLAVQSVKWFVYDRKEIQILDLFLLYYQETVESIALLCWSTSLVIIYV